MSGAIAGAEEVLRTITGIMRGDCADESGAGPKIAERFRAAELLAKRYGLLEDAADASREREAAAREIEAMIRRFAEEREGEEGDAPSSTGTPLPG